MPKIEYNDDTGKREFEAKLGDSHGRARGVGSGLGGGGDDSEGDGSGGGRGRGGSGGVGSGGGGKVIEDRRFGIYDGRAVKVDSTFSPC